ncbi:G-protein coupled receptor 52-like [Chiloscyllium punctatum]|uniref:G-protein coupled receptor 52-like n=1 Tax=Chiloscyllium punctatum TaxID=137246 RepID=UPI003B63EF41
MNQTTVEWRAVSVSNTSVNLSNHACPLGFGHYDAVDVCVLETAIIVLLTVLIILGNLTVIFVFHCAPLLHHYTTSYFIQTMAYADLLVGVSCLVPALSLLHYPTGMQESLTCQVFGYIISVLKSVSMACLACISIDRYLAITKPLSYSQLVTPCRLRLCIILIWIYSCAVFLPSFFGWEKPGYHGDIFEWCATSWETNAYFTGFIVCLLYAPAAFIVCFTYFHIFKICRQHTKEINERRARFPSQDVEAAEGGPSPDRRYAMVLFRITSVFYVLWLPYILYFLLESSRVLESPSLSFVTTWLAISNSFCNCVIYNLSNSVFRLGLRRLSQMACSLCLPLGNETARDPKPRKRANSCSI